VSSEAVTGTTKGAVKEKSEVEAATNSCTGFKIVLNNLTGFKIVLNNLQNAHFNTALLF
jgi:hypothetical protein